MTSKQFHWFIIAVFVGAGCAKTPVPVPGLVALDAEWQSFRWLDIRIGSVTVERAAILVDAVDTAIVGRQRGDASGPLPMQLDFGFAGTGSHGLPLRMVVYDTNTAPASRRIAGTLGRLGPREDSVAVAGGRVMGTLGLLYFGMKGLLVDQVEQRLGAPTAGRALPPEIVRQMEWADGREDAGRFRVPLLAGSGTIGDLLIDPGSSLVPLLLDQPTWRRVTGHNGSEAEHVRISLPTAAEPLVLVGAKPRVPLAIGAITIDPAMVYFASSGPADLARPRLGNGVVGVIGNQLFKPYRLIYLNVRSKQLGIVR